jgi:hypothetical protein
MLMLGRHGGSVGGREQAQLEKTHGQPTPERLGKEASIVMNISIITDLLSDELHRDRS